MRACEEMTRKINLKTREARIQRRRRYHYYSTTPFVSLIKEEHHQTFHIWYDKKLRSFLSGAEGIDFYEIYKFNFKLKPYSKDTSYSAFIFSLAKFLSDIGRGDGLTVKLSMIFRYLTDKNHSNLPMQEDDLKYQVYKAFRLIN